MKILAVGMLDVATFGSDAFFVQINDTQVMFYVVHRDGRLDADPPEPQSMTEMYSSIEKFGHCYLVDKPVEIHALSELPSYLGRFELTERGECRLKQP